MNNSISKTNMEPYFAFSGKWRKELVYKIGIVGGRGEWEESRRNRPHANWSHVLDVLSFISSTSGPSPIPESILPYRPTLPYELPRYCRMYVRMCVYLLWGWASEFGPISSQHYSPESNTECFASSSNFFSFQIEFVCVRIDETIQKLLWTFITIASDRQTLLFRFTVPSCCKNRL